MMNLTDVDSEADRREAIRRRIVDDAVREARRVIDDNMVTSATAERSYLELAVATRLLNGLTGKIEDGL